MYDISSGNACGGLRSSRRWQEGGGQGLSCSHRHLKPDGQHKPVFISNTEEFLVHDMFSAESVRMMSLLGSSSLDLCSHSSQPLSLCVCVCVGG